MEIFYVICLIKIDDVIMDVIIVAIVEMFYIDDENILS